MNTIFAAVHSWNFLKAKFEQQERRKIDELRWFFKFTTLVWLRVDPLASCTKRALSNNNKGIKTTVTMFKGRKTFPPQICSLTAQAFMSTSKGELLAPATPSTSTGVDFTARRKTVRRCMFMQIEAGTKRLIIKIEQPWKLNEIFPRADSRRLNDNASHRKVKPHRRALIKLYVESLAGWMIHDIVLFVHSNAPVCSFIH